MDKGFVDGGGKRYRPSVVRVGSEFSPITPRARDVWVDELIRRACMLLLLSRTILGTFATSPTRTGCSSLDVPGPAHVKQPGTGVLRAM